MLMILKDDCGVHGVQGVTCMRHCTDDVLVREVAADPLLSSYR